ncbi:hypothetical protein MIND_00414300 [Mycena indigotica]|uniref:Uncharacterized protein n=1 Tax=Mycena indigotica TaxID=2126181 RepID=A0A8H6SXN7_9AGAR|nr:uncharacterized protein MIND_00414300 [Mycena indigotica]KAF7306237.1 hypothetical protein MIND_00414300 [Mycena indigotica]
MVEEAIQALKDRAQADVAEKKKEFAKFKKDGVPTTPEFRERCIEEFQNFFWGIAMRLAEFTGCHVFCMIGGPRPLARGPTYFGANQAPSPVPWPAWDKERFQKMIDFWMEYLETAFTEEQKADAALPKKTDGLDGLISMNDETQHVDFLQVTESDLDGVDSGDDEVTSSLRKKRDVKAKEKGKGKEKAKEGKGKEKAKEKAQEKPTPSTKAKASTSRKAPTVKKANKSAGIAGRGPGSDIETSEGSDIKSSQSLAANRARREKKKGKSMMPDLQPPPIPPVVVPPPIGMQPPPPSPPVGSQPPPIPPVVVPPPIGMQPPPPIPPVGSQPHPPVGNQPLPPTDAPAWFHDLHNELIRMEAGPQYHHMLRLLGQLERAYGWIDKQASLSNVDRPSQVAAWFKRARKWTAANDDIRIKDVAAFATQWRVWWTRRQPTWRKGPAGELLRGGIGWSKLGRSCVARQERNLPLSKLWEEATAEVTWVLENLVKDAPTEIIRLRADWQQQEANGQGKKGKRKL